MRPRFPIQCRWPRCACYETWWLSGPSRGPAHPEPSELSGGALWARQATGIRSGPSLVQRLADPRAAFAGLHASRSRPSAWAPLASFSLLRPRRDVLLRALPALDRGSHCSPNTSAAWGRGLFRGRAGAQWGRCGCGARHRTPCLKSPAWDTWCGLANSHS